MSEEKLAKLTIDSDVETRKGVQADVVLMVEKDGSVRMDFISTDITEDDGNLRGALTSRVYMSKNDLRSLRDTIDAALRRRPDAGKEER